jgi:glyoxylase-like metal-dependent hydrolase (beta-lactamase superfamily II)
MRQTLAATSLVVFALLTARTASQNQGLPLRQDVEILKAGPTRAERVKEGLYVIRGPFVPCGTRGCRPGGADDGLIHEPGDVAVRVTPEGVILVDDKYPENLTDVLAALRTVTAQPIRYMLNSHHHGDHVSGNVNVAAMGVDIIAHRNIRENSLRIKQPGAPNIVFEDRGGLYLGGVEVRMYHFGRGHTNGDTVIHFPDLRAIHMGDLVIDGMPVIDYAGGGSALEFVKTIDGLLALDFDVAIPGHGKVMTKDEVRAYRVRFETMNQRMRELIKKGVTKDQVTTLAGARAQLRLADLGWDNSVSTTASLNSFSQYYDELAAAK